VNKSEDVARQAKVVGKHMHQEQRVVNAVERGPAEALTQQPAHPYTQLLVASAPDPDNLGGMLRQGGKHTVRPGAGAAAEGCPFHPRCPFADDQCRAEDPALQRVSGTRAAACWHLDAAAASGAATAGRESEV
jgi:peptide/nickel transport system ATP-binding protein